MKSITFLHRLIKLPPRDQTMMRFFWSGNSFGNWIRIDGIGRDNIGSVGMRRGIMWWEFRRIRIEECFICGCVTCYINLKAHLLTSSFHDPLHWRLWKQCEGVSLYWRHLKVNSGTLKSQHIVAWNCVVFPKYTNAELSCLVCQKKFITE